MTYAGNRADWYRQQTTPRRMRSVGDMGEHASTVRFSYTVPTGKRAYIMNALVEIIRRQDAGLNDVSSAYISVTIVEGDVSIVHVMRTLPLNWDIRQAVGEAGILLAGESIQGTTEDLSQGGGICSYNLSTNVCEFS